MRAQPIKVLRQPKKCPLLQSDLPIHVPERQESQISRIREG